MGTMISLALNGIDIDWGKNRYWKSHHWLFPPGSLTDVDYLYADDVIERKPGFETTLNEAYFRLCHLGYSQQETKMKFEAAVVRWNRTSTLNLSFADFRDALTSVAFASLTSADLEPYLLDFRRFVGNLLAAWDTEDASLEDFIESLDSTLILRVLADREENRSLPLRWHHQDLIDNGWASLADLTDIDLPIFIVNHTVLYGRLQDYAKAADLDEFDKWLVGNGLSRATPYSRIKRDGKVVTKKTTLPTAVRNMIHHPENTQNDILSDADLRESTELLLGIVKRLSPPLLGVI